MPKPIEFLAQEEQEIIAMMRYSMENKSKGRLVPAENAKELTKNIQKNPKLQRIAKEMACEFFGKKVIEAELDQAAL